MSELFAPSLIEQVACVQREIAMREVVYDRRVGAGKMSRAIADRELETMRAVLATLLSLTVTA